MNNEQKIKAIVKAIGYVENGGKPDPKNTKAGKTGELKSVFQFTPATWRGYSKEVFGKEMPLTPDNETYVVQQKVAGWVNKGWTTKQIASAWNAGEGEKDAWTGKFTNGSPSKSINKKYNVKFDVPSYANKVESYATSFEKGDNQTLPKDTKELVRKFVEDRVYSVGQRNPEKVPTQQPQGLMQQSVIKPLI